MHATIIKFKFAVHVTSLVYRCALINKTSNFLEGMRGYKKKTPCSRTSREFLHCSGPILEQYGSTLSPVLTAAILERGSVES